MIDGKTTFLNGEREIWELVGNEQIIWRIEMTNGKWKMQFLKLHTLWLCDGPADGDDNCNCCIMCHAKWESLSWAIRKTTTIIIHNNNHNNYIISVADSGN